jgi:hypothetical protein
MLRAEKTDPVTQAEYRLMATVLGSLVTLIIAAGSWWLTNQQATLGAVQKDLEEYTERVEDNYVRKEYIDMVLDRLDRIEDKVDTLRVENTRDPVKATRERRSSVQPLDHIGPKQGGNQE